MASGDGAALTFLPGVDWSGTFVKRAVLRGRPVEFHFSPQLVINLLQPDPADPGPVRTVERNGPRIEAACLVALERAGAGNNRIRLAAGDFVPADS